MQRKRSIAKESMLRMSLDLRCSMIAKEIALEFQTNSRVAYETSYNLFVKLMGL